MTATEPPARPAVVSEMDVRHLAVIRESVRELMRHAATTYATSPGRLLDIAPQVHEGARPFFPESVTVDTFDIDPASGCTYIGDICERNAAIDDRSYDYVVCTEVLEHTLRPWDAVAEMFRVLRPGGYLFLSVPFNFRIHGPLPDCWRFTEHGLRAILGAFRVVELRGVPTPDRDLMPIHYAVVAQRPQ